MSRVESKDPDLSLYCKQSTIESWHDAPWACGFSSIVTAMRLLGERELRGDELVRQFRQAGGRPKEGIEASDLRDIARAFGYRVRSFPAVLRTDGDEFKGWLLSAWRHNRPTVVACGSGARHDHYVCAYSNPEDRGVWVMDPYVKSEPFSFMNWRDFLEWTGDCSGDYWEWEAHEIAAKDGSHGVVPPSTALFEWVNGLPGKVADRDAVAAAFVDNFFESTRAYRPNGANGVRLERVLRANGALWNKLTEWEAFYDDDDFKALSEMRGVAADLDAHLQLKVDRDRLEGLVGDLALVMVHAFLHRSWRL